jgi:hypothetical protein
VKLRSLSCSEKYVNGLLQTRRAMYVYRSVQARSFNRCCSGKTVNITYCECMFVAVGTRHLVRIRHIVISDLSRCTVFPYYLIKGTIFENKIFEPKMCVLISPANFIRNISYPTKNRGNYDQKCILVFMYSIRFDCQISMNLEVIRQIL